LTPGTVTLGIDGPELQVHSLTAEAAADLERGEMNSRVASLERWT
jgi:multicomponent Na+:H+ antiporter subunit E